MPEAGVILTPSPARPATGRRAGIPFRDLMRWYRDMVRNERRRRYGTGIVTTIDIDAMDPGKQSGTRSSFDAWR